MSDHTPPPWTLCPPDPEGNAQIESPHVMVGEVYDVEEPEGTANARLIAAAPDLLGAAVDLVDSLRRGAWDAFDPCPLREAIAKATGEGDA